MKLIKYRIEETIDRSIDPKNETIVKKQIVEDQIIINDSSITGGVAEIFKLIKKLYIDKGYVEAP